MDMFLLLTVLSVFFLLFISSFFSGAETALTAASRARMHGLEQEGNQRASLVNRLLAAPERIIGTVLIGNNLVNILATSVTTSALIGLFGEAGVVYATMLMTPLVVIFCEVLPKTYSIAYPDRVALALAPTMRWLIWLLTPLTTLTQLVVRQLLKLTPTHKDDEANILDPHDEIRGAIELQHMEGAVKKGDRDMLGGVLDLPELQVADIMVHRTKMEMLNVEETPQQVIEAVLKSQYTRIPVWRGDPQNIVGVLNAKDLFAALSASQWNVAALDIAKLLKDPWFVPETRSVKDQLNAFLRRKAHVALIVDEYGVVQGLVTLEDVLEEIVGQISDEHDVDAPGIRVQADGTVVVDGSTPVRDLNRQLDWSLPDEEATTIAGLVIHEAQTIPEQGQAFTFHGFRFEIMRKSRNRITVLRVRPPEGLRRTATPAAQTAPAAPTAPATAQAPAPVRPEAGQQQPANSSSATSH
jgi:Mg2+/Co2+ transporter CorB